MTCACETLTYNENEDLLQQFMACWKQCPTLNLLLIPDWAEFDAAKQLEGKDGIRIAVAVIDDYISWPTFELALEHGLVDWNSPRFISENPKMKDFLAG